MTSNALLAHRLLAVANSWAWGSDENTAPAHPEVHEELLAIAEALAPGTWRVCPCHNVADCAEPPCSPDCGLTTCGYGEDR